MDPVTIGTVVASMLSTAFAQGVGGEAAKHAVQSIVGLVRGRLTGNGRGDTELAALEQNPADGDAVAAVGRIIDAEAADETFRQQLRALISEARQDAAMNNFVTNVESGANVGKIVNIGHIDNAQF
ncbi:hypothetical protein BJY16_004840 [Actinoplanes octamycinicus]|uniref:Uncharacterized protein n=1 Tax=Actinoplanes octamycinicus TaxID=135948 RepID=A0A7W7GZV3_9ACTN|nr:hypothetical protein [Actinoplanes octamycinicus]MBB4741381.1 hypothetical protein [Actinoplanes octamycinicus]GIE62821.1 hypothetical protein Aoc01nite_82230 [Actinoplanes octamycinicus]